MNREGVRLVMQLVKFRRACKQLPALETPDYIAVVNAIRDMIESADRLCNVMMEGYEEREPGKRRIDINRRTVVIGGRFESVN